MKAFALLLLSALLLPVTLAAVDDPDCAPPIRVVSRDVVIDEKTRIYVVQYHFADSDYLFIYEESNGVPGVQTHFDEGAGCDTAAERDTLIHGSGGNVFRYPPL
jgi:hypothetical protein